MDTMEEATDKGGMKREQEEEEEKRRQILESAV